MKRIFFHSFLVLLFSSCSTDIFQTREKKANLWKNRNSEEIVSHPFFRKMELKKTKSGTDQEIWVFTEKSIGTLKRNCLRVTNQPCILYPEYRCEMTFKIKKNVVNDFFSRGHCPHKKEFSPP